MTALQNLIDEGSPGEIQNAIATLGLELRRLIGADDAAHRRFMLVRDQDVSGQSGTGFVAEGCQYSTGVTVIQWLGPHASTVVWSNIESALAIHGHGGRTRVVWLDD
jgi:hypothetical protein